MNFSIILNFIFIVIAGVLAYLYYKKKICSVDDKACPVCPAASAAKECPAVPVCPAAQTACANIGISVDTNSRFSNIYTQLQRVISSAQKGVCTSYNNDTIIQELYKTIDRNPDVRTCKEFKDMLNASLAATKARGLALDSENAQAIDLLQNLVLLVANEICKDGDDSKVAVAQFKSIIKDLLNSMCPMSEIEKFNPVRVSTKMSSYR